MGEPQYRLREMDQSRALATHVPNCPCFTLPGIQVISSFSSSMRSLIWVTLTYQDVTAR